MFIGRTLEAQGNFEGAIDDVRVWNVARTGAQIAASRNAELMGNEAGLMAYLKANEGTEAQLIDASGRGNTGVVRNIYTPASATIAGRIDHPGQRDFYTFTLDTAKQLYFDSLTQNAGMNWTLTGPRGAVVSARSFTTSDSFDFGLGSPVLDLPAGDYSLMIDVAGDQTAPYAFRLLDLSQATAINPGTVVNTTLNPSRTTDLYRLTANAGDQFFFDSLSAVGGDITWRLVNPYGKVVFDRTAMASDVGPIRLDTAGDYTLMIEGRINTSGSASYSFNVDPRGNVAVPAPSGTALTIGSTVSESISVASEQDRYVFTLAAASRLCFDSFTNNPNIHWTLTGPQGVIVLARNFAASDANSGNAMLDLPAGDYQLSVAGAASNIGAYSFRLFDLSQALALVPGTPVSAQLNPANKTEAYQFNALAGERYYFDFLSLSGNAASATWRLLDPYGNSVFAAQNLDAGDVGLLTFAYSGAYTLLIEGKVAATGSTGYSFNVQKVTDDTTPLVLGASTLGAIAHVGQRDFYTFSLAQAKQLAFDALSNNANLTWTLNGPRGPVVLPRSFTASDAASGNPLLDLVAGDYVLMVDAPADQTPSYAFRLLDLAQAAVLTPGTAVSSQLSPANESDAYQFAAQAGDVFYFDFISTSGGAGASTWRLLDPYGNTVFGPLNLDAGDVGLRTLPSSGTYTLLLEGAIGATGTTSYSFNAQKVSDDSATLTLGTTVTAAISHVGQRDFYTFSLAQASLLAFDAFTNNANLSWSLNGPYGPVVLPRSFTASDAASGNSLLELRAGDYVLMIDAPADQLPAYSFRLLDVMQATAITSGIAVSGQLSPANETDLYQFDAVAGDLYYFDFLSSSGAAGSMTWRLLDPYGNTVFGPSNFDAGDIGPRALPASGKYTLLLEGSIAATGSTSYSFKTQKVQDDSAALVFGTTVTGNIEHAGQRDVYSFSLAQAKQLAFDSFTNNPNVVWSLIGPRGPLVLPRGFNTSDANSGNAILDLPAGDYVLTVAGVTGQTPAYSFRVLDLSQATVIDNGVEVTGQLNPGNKTEMYRFQAWAGTRAYFDFLNCSGAAGTVTWRLLDPFGNNMFGPTNFNADIGMLTLPSDGIYTLLIEGNVANSAATTFGFKVQKIGDETSSLSLGANVSGSIAHPGQRDFFTFSLASTKQIAFDALLGNSNLTWNLYGPRGPVVLPRNFAASDAGSGNSVMELVAGEYVLTVAAVADFTPSYAFRLFDLAQATPINAGTVINGQLNPANETDAYRFEATRGDQYYFDFLSNSAGAGSNTWRLIDPNGVTLFGPSNFSSDIGLMTLPTTGTYTLLMEGSFTAGGSTNYSFNAQPVPISATVVISGLGGVPGPDLVVRNLTLTPVGEKIESGSEVLVSWDALNIGELAAKGNWRDRIVVKNTTRNETIGNYLISYTDVGDLEPNALRKRQIKIQLPDGNKGVGELSFQVTTDVSNVVTEPGSGGEAELNNSASLSVPSSLAKYSDLTISHISVEPPGAWVAGSSVTLHWRDNNIGANPAIKAWNDTVLIRNLTTGQVIATADLRYDPLVDGPLNAGASAERAYTLVWPSGLAGIGQFEFSVMADSGQELFESNPSETAESNNSAKINASAGPDLRVRNLVTSQSQVQAGSMVTVNWEVLNDGGVPIPTGFNERIVVTNKTTGEKLLDTSVAYDPAQSGNGLIGAGEFRPRSFQFRLPDGRRGIGDIEIRVTSDQNSAGSGILYETNAQGDAETNNSALVHTTGQAVPYADLAVSDVQVPSSGISTRTINVGWTVSNNGSAATSAAWDDQIILSTDNYLGNDDDVVLGTYRHIGVLQTGESYAQIKAVSLPLKPEGRYYIFVKSDSRAEVTEPDTRSDNVSSAQAINLTQPYTDLLLESVSAPSQAQSGENIAVSWQVKNIGNATSVLALWDDKIVLSRDATFSNDDIVLASSVSHAGLLDPNQSYTGRATVQLPRELEGEFYILVDANSTRSLTEGGRTSNNSAASTLLRITLAPSADLIVSNVSGPEQVLPGAVVSVAYTASNRGQVAANAPWRDRVFLDVGGNSGSNLIAMGDKVFNDGLAVGADMTRSISFTVPSNIPQGTFRWVVKTDVDNVVYERAAENNNQAVAATAVFVSNADLVVNRIAGPGLVTSGDTIRITWSAVNNGGVALGTWVDQVYLAKDGQTTLFAQVPHNGPLAQGEQYDSFADLSLPLGYAGEYQVIVVANGTSVLAETQRENNRATQAMSVTLAAYADLAVSNVTAPALTIADPASINVAWRVDNLGTGVGKTTSWVDRVIMSSDDILGNGDDRVLGSYQHDGALASGEFYERNERIALAAATSGRFKIFVVSDAKAEVFENGLESNNSARAANSVDVMPSPYADLQIGSVTTQGAAASGRALRVTWDVANRGIGLTNTAEWSDQVWLSRKPDGSEIVAQLGSYSHIGQLAVNDQYSRSVEVMLPEGIAGDFYINVRTGGPFEFIYTNNNTASSIAIPVTLSKSPDLKVESITLPTSAQEGALIDVSWSVINQGEAAAGGVWTDTVLLLPESGQGSSVTLGSFTYDRGVEPGIRYARTEQVRLPVKIEGRYRVKVITNANNQLYEHGAARNNNSLLSTDVTEVALNDRPDLRVGNLVVPDHVTAGGSATIRFSIANQGPTATSGRWKDKVYLSLDGNLSGDDVLLGQYDNGSALSPSESYSTESGAVNIPIRFRGDAYLIVVADGNNNIDEYPSEGNNVKAARFYVDPIPFGDLVASDVVAPSQAVHGANIEVRYKVTNRGQVTTRGEAANISSWTDTIWLARDKRRPGAHKGDVLLGSVTHNGNLAAGEDYLGTANVSLPGNIYSGNYFITVWSDTYDAILEDTLASQTNPDDPNQVDNNNYKARPISVLGITPPDLSVLEVSGLSVVDVGANFSGNYTFSYTVQNIGEQFSGSWNDSVYLTDNPVFEQAREVWHLGDFTQARSLGNKEKYSVTQTVPLAPSMKARYIIVKSDAMSQVGELDETNNRASNNAMVTPHAADLQVTRVETQPENFSGEETLVSWTVTNQGEAVWAGTQNWVDAIYFSTDPVFIPGRASLLSRELHSNVAGLANGQSYTTSTKVRLPAGTDGPYYIYIITDVDRYRAAANSEAFTGGNNQGVREFYQGTVFEGLRNDNNIARGTLNITYREPDLQIDQITVSDPIAASGQQITVTWTATNRGTRDVRTNSWYDGVYLSRDNSLDGSDYPLVDRGSQTETELRIRATSLFEDNKPKYLKPGQSYTNTATFSLPESIQGNFHIIVKTDTSTTKDRYGREASSIRDGLATLANDIISDSVKEFKDEGNNVTSIPFKIEMRTPPDLQVTQVTAPDKVLAGQAFSVAYTVHNAGGQTPSDQSSWNDLIYLSKDRFLDVNQDRYVGYVGRSGGLAADGRYNANLTVTAPRDLEGAYYVFVITDPARTWGTGEFGAVREFGKEQNNATAAVQPIIVETPPPADLKVTTVSLPAHANVGDEVQIEYSVVNDSSNQAYGRWTDAVYLSRDNNWDLGDILLGKVDHNGGLIAGASYANSLRAKLPPLKDGNWRIIVRPDLYNEVFEGKITYTSTGLNLPPGEANNRTASGSTLEVQVPTLALANTLPTTLSAGPSTAVQSKRCQWRNPARDT